MNRVPEGKRVYIGARKFLSGEALPPFVMLDEVEMLTKKQVDTRAKKFETE
jgi:hypothetical protein